MVRLRSAGLDSKPSSSAIPHQEMSDTKEKDDTGEDMAVDVSDSAQKIELVESGDAQETRKPAENGETGLDKMDIEKKEAKGDNVGPHNGGVGELVRQGDENLSDVKSEGPDLLQSSENGCEEKTELDTSRAGVSDMKAENKNGKEMEDKVNGEVTTPMSNGKSNSKYMIVSNDSHTYDGNDSGTEEEQLDFIKAIESFFKERSMEFKPPKFYGDTVNCLKLYRIVTRLGGYDQVTSSKLWSKVGASFKPPRTCTTVSWSFRGFYEKGLLDYEKYETDGGKLSLSISSQPKPMKVDKPTKVDKTTKVDKPVKVDKPTKVNKPTTADKPMDVDNQASGSGRTRRSAATRAMEGWHSQRLLGNGEVSEPIIKDKSSNALQKQEKQLKSSGSHKRKKPTNVDPVVKAARTPTKLQLDIDVSDLGPPADWVKVNVQKSKDCFEVYALVPGLLREEVRVQTDPAGRLVISGEPEHPDNPWGVTAFKKAISLPSRIDPQSTSAVVTLHGQLFVRAPFEQSE